MKGTAEVLRAARERGIELIPEGENLRYRAPPGSLTTNLLSELKRHKPDLLVLLSSGALYACRVCGRFSFTRPRTCFWCERATDMEVTA